jgi:hypothetical protein
VGVEAVLRSSTSAGSAVAAYGAPVQNHEIAGHHVAYRDTGALDDTGGLVAEQEREGVADAAVAIGEVGVAHTAGSYRHHDVAWSGSGMPISTSSTAAPLLRAMIPRTCSTTCVLSVAPVRLLVGRA